MQVEIGKTYVGVVEDNNDPNKLGRVKVRVLDVFDNTPLEDIPFANPWKDLSGDEFRVPDKGKIVTVVFENANINSPEYIFSDHYNINLEKKLSGLSDDDYNSMKSLIFDHKTQVYVNESEGLKLDHKFNLINIKEKSIDVALKDNFGKINLGTANSTQRVILGDNFLNWFDDFVKILMGDQGGPFLGNMGAPVQATPAMLACIELYNQMKDPKFLSKNVYAVDNDDVKKLDRIADGQKGDTWKSTVKNNNLTSKEPIPFTSTDGSGNTTFNQPNINTPLSLTQSMVPKIPTSKPSPSENPNVSILIQLLKNKSYILYEDIYKMNIIAVRNQCQRIGDKYTDQFVDKLYLLYKKEDGNWDLKQYMISTVPGLEFTITDSWLTEKNLKNTSPWVNSAGKKIYMKEYSNIAGSINGDPNLENGLPILATSQYIDVYYLSQYRGEKAFLTINGASQLIWRDKDKDNPDIFNPHNYTSPELLKINSFNDNGVKLHLGYPGGKNVGNWSEGDQVFSDSSSLNEFFGYCEKHLQKYGNKFSYTLVNKTDWDEASVNLESNKVANNLSSTQSQYILQSVSNSTSNSGSTQSATQSQYTNASEYIISILNPTSQAAKNVSGLINISKSNNLYNTSGQVSNLPDGSMIGPISINPVSQTSNISTDSLADQMISVLEDQISNKFKVKIKLVVVDKK